MEFFECSISGVTIDIFVFFNRVLLYKRKFFDCNLSEKWSLYFMEKNRFNFLIWVKKLKFLSTLSHFRFWFRPKKNLFSKAAPLAGNFWLGTWWKILGWSLRRKNSLKEMFLHYQEQALEESGNQKSNSKIAVYGGAIQSFCWSV